MDELETNMQYLSTVFKQDAKVIDTPNIVDKRWGHEEIFINDQYCMKMLIIKPGCKTSMHFHVQKHETILVTEGVLKLTYKDPNGNAVVRLVNTGDAIVIPPGFMHQLEAIEGRVVLVEASTRDDSTDSVRVNM